MDIFVIIEFMEENLGEIPGKRASHNKELRKNIYSAVAYYLENKLYESITVRGICSRANIKTSSFYNLYGSLESFLFEYLIDVFDTYATESGRKKTNVRGVAKIIEGYMLFAKFADNKGVEYIQFFQKQYGVALLVSNYRLSENPVVSKIKHEFDIAYHEAVCLNEIDAKVESSVIFSYLDMIVYANLFNWCNNGGRINLLGITEFFLMDFLKSGITNEKIKILKKNLNV